MKRNLNQMWQVMHKELPNSVWNQISNLKAPKKPTLCVAKSAGITTAILSPMKASSNSLNDLRMARRRSR